MGKYCLFTAQMYQIHPIYPGILCDINTMRNPFHIIFFLHIGTELFLKFHTCNQ